MSGEQTLEGQETTIRCVSDGDLVAELKFFTSFNEAVKQEIKENGYLGEPFMRYTDIFNGYSGDFEFHVNTAAWVNWDAALTSRAQRRTAASTFEVVRVDQFSDGTNVTFTYKDVAWSERPTSVGSRADKVKVKGSFSCSERDVQQNAFV